MFRVYLFSILLQAFTPRVQRTQSYSAEHAPWGHGLLQGVGGLKRVVVFWGALWLYQVWQGFRRGLHGLFIRPALSRLRK